MTWCVEDYSMIKTDRVIYRTRTQEEYDWLMAKLDEAGCEVAINPLLQGFKYTWSIHMADTCVWVENKTIRFTGINYYETNKAYEDYEYIEVSDLMENEEFQKELEAIEVRFE